MKNELDHLLVLVFTDPSNERLRCELLAGLVSGQTVFGKTVVEVLEDCENMTKTDRRRRDTSEIDNKDRGSTKTWVSTKVQHIRYPGSLYATYCHVHER